MASKIGEIGSGGGSPCTAELGADSSPIHDVPIYITKIVFVCAKLK